MFSCAFLLHLWFSSNPPAHIPIKPFRVHCLRGEVWLYGKEKITKNPLSLLVQRQMCLEKQKSLDKMPAGGNRGHFLLPRLERFPELVEHKREGQLASAQVSISVLRESVNNRKGISMGPRWKGPVLCFRVPGRQQNPPEGWWDPKVEETYTLGLNRSPPKEARPLRRSISTHGPQQKKKNNEWRIPLWTDTMKDQMVPIPLPSRGQTQAPQVLSVRRTEPASEPEFTCVVWNLLKSLQLSFSMLEHGKSGLGTT